MGCNQFLNRLMEADKEQKIGVFDPVFHLLEQFCEGIDKFCGPAHVRCSIMSHGPLENGYHYDVYAEQYRKSIKLFTVNAEETDLVGTRDRFTLKILSQGEWAESTRVCYTLEDLKSYLLSICENFPVLLRANWKPKIQLVQPFKMPDVKPDFIPAFRDCSG